MSHPAASPDIDFILSQLSKLVPAGNFREEHILITGGTGFFGKWITQAILAANDQKKSANKISLITRDSKKTLESLPWLKNRADVRLIQTDIRKFEPDEDYTSVIHGAAAASQALNENDPVQMFDTIVEGTRNVLKATHSKSCRRFQFLSSGGVYGQQPSELSHIPENYPGAPLTTDPRAAYGEAKRAAEFLCAEAERQKGFRLSLPRCFAFVGPYLPLDIHFAAGNFIRAVLDGKPIEIAGDGTPYRSYLYSADLVVWLLALLFSDRGPAIVNVGSDQAVTIGELAMAAHEAGLRLLPERRRLQNPIHIAKPAVQGAKPARYVPLTDLAKQSYGLSVWTPLADALSKTIQWHLHHGPLAR